MDTLFGLPAHPFLVHIPIVLLPLAAIGVVMMVVRPLWYRRYRWAVLVVGAIGTLGAILAASAGEELERRIIAVEGQDAASSWEHHADLGDTARTVAIAFFVVLAAYVLIPWWIDRQRGGPASQDGTLDDAELGVTNGETGSSDRRRWLRVGLAALAVVGAAATVTTVVQAGHTGSKSVWEDYVGKTSSGG